MSIIFTDLFDSRVFSEYWREIDPTLKEPFIGEKIFPMEKEIGLELSWIKGYNDYSAVLQPSAFDAQAPYRDRIGVEKIITEMPFFRERMRIGEKEKAKIRTLLVNGKEQAMPVVRRVYNDVVKLVNGARAQVERMRMSLLADGKISIKAGLETGTDVQYEYNYDKDGVWAKLNTRELSKDKQWTDDNKAKSKPLEDILNFYIYLRRHRSVVPKKILMNLNTFLQMMHSESIVKAMNPLAATNFFLTPVMAKEYMQQQLGLEIIVYEKYYKDENKNVSPYFPDGVVTFLPDFPVGNTWFGVTPEEGDLMANEIKVARTSVIDNGIAVTTMVVPHPVNVETIVSMVCLPSFERMEDVGRLKVF